eukprot:scaffold347587_cov19-Prasinocladus_malaysianus.AAC.1
MVGGRLSLVGGYSGRLKEMGSGAWKRPKIALLLRMGARRRAISSTEWGLLGRREAFKECQRANQDSHVGLGENMLLEGRLDASKSWSLARGTKICSAILGMPFLQTLGEGVSRINFMVAWGCRALAGSTSGRSAT